MARHRRHRRRAGRALEPAAGRRRLAGLPPVHLRLDRRAQGRDAPPRQPAPQPGADPPRLRRPPRRPGRHLAAALPRHGVDRRHPPAALRRLPGDAVLADGLPPAAGPLAGGDLPDPGERLRRPQLRLRPGGEEDRSGAARRPRSLELAGRVQRRRAGPGRDPGAFRQGVRAVAVRPARLLPLLRPRRRHAPGDRRRAGRGGAGRTVPRRRARGPPGGAGRPAERRGDRTHERAGGERPLTARAAGAGGRPGARCALQRGGGGGDLDRRAERRRRLLGQGGGDRRDLRRPARRRRALPAHGRPGIPRSRRAVRHRPDQGPDHPARPQLLPPGPRALGRARPPGAPGRRRRGVRRRGGRGGAAGAGPGAAPGPPGRRPGGDRRGGAPGPGPGPRGPAPRPRPDQAGDPAQDLERQGAPARDPRGVPRAASSTWSPCGRTAPGRPPERLPVRSRASRSRSELCSRPPRRPGPPPRRPSLRPRPRRPPSPGWPPPWRARPAWAPSRSISTGRSRTTASTPCR